MTYQEIAEAMANYGHIESFFQNYQKSEGRDNQYQFRIVSLDVDQSLGQVTIVIAEEDSVVRSVVAVTDGGGATTSVFQTSAPHGLKVGQEVTLAVGAYTGVFAIDYINSETEFEVSIPYTATDTGTVTLYSRTFVFPTEAPSL